MKRTLDLISRRAFTEDASRKLSWDSSDDADVLDAKTATRLALADSIIAYEKNRRSESGRDGTALRAAQFVALEAAIAADSAAQGAE